MVSGQKMLLCAWVAAIPLGYIAVADERRPAEMAGPWGTDPASTNDLQNDLRGHSSGGHLRRQGQELSSNGGTACTVKDLQTRSPCVGDDDFAVPTLTPIDLPARAPKSWTHRRRGRAPAVWCRAGGDAGGHRGATHFFPSQDWRSSGSKPTAPLHYSGSRLRCRKKRPAARRDNITHDISAEKTVFTR